MLLRLALSVCLFLFVCFFFCAYLSLHRCCGALYFAEICCVYVGVCVKTQSLESLASVNVSKVNDHESLLTFYIGICIHFTLLYLVGNFKSLLFVAFFTTSMLHILASNLLEFCRSVLSQQQSFRTCHLLFATCVWCTYVCVRVLRNRVNCFGPLLVYKWLYILYIGIWMYIYMFVNAGVLRNRQIYCLSQSFQCDCWPGQTKPVKIHKKPKKKEKWNE